MINRFILFIGDRYYPGGGWRDYAGSFATVEAVKTELLKRATDTACHQYDWWHIVDLQTGEIVERNQ